MADTPGRLLQLLGLLQVARVWTGAELADRLGVTTRTVRNDVERLRGLGYRIDGLRGSAGGYRLAAGSKMPPLLLDDADVAVVTASLLTSSTGSVAGMAEHAKRALAKLEQVMPQSLQRRANALRNAVVQVPADTAPPSVDPEVLALISAACRDQEVLRFDYHTHESEHRSRRIVEPHRLVNWGRRWYLFGYDTTKRDWRTYPVDRISPNPPVGPRFRPPVDDRVPPAAGVIEPIDDRSCTFATGADDLTALAAHLGRLDVDFHVDGPPELVAALRDLAERYSRAITPNPIRTP